MERYEILKDIGAGNFAVTKLVREKCSKQLYAIKLIERGKKIDENVQREVMNHRSLKHTNIVEFKEVLLTPTHLGIVMEYAAGGELYERICKAGKFSEDEFTHSGKRKNIHLFLKMQVCHRDLKLENALLDGGTTPRLKICDFGYSKSLLQSQPKSVVGTPNYIAPEVLSRKKYDGKISDVWSCGVTLFVMIVGGYPFEDPQDPINFTKTIRRIISVHYSIPQEIGVSMECIHLFYKIFVADPAKRITIPEIKKHPWFLKNLPMEMMEGGSWESNEVNNPAQSVEEVQCILQEARKPRRNPTISRHLVGSSMALDDADVGGPDANGDFVG